MPTVAILGASSNLAKFGNKSVRAHQAAGYQVIPVNPQGGQIEGLTVASSLADLPRRLDRISIYLPPQLTRAALPEIAPLDAAEVYFNPGTYTPEILAEARQLGIAVIDDCSIVALGYSPSQFPG